MVADYFTKHIQESLFKKLMDVIMGHTHPDSLLEVTPPLVKERVRNKEESQIVSERLNVRNGSVGIDRGIKPKKNTSVGFQQTKPTYTEGAARNEPG